MFKVTQVDKTPFYTRYYLTDGFVEIYVDIDGISHIKGNISLNSDKLPEVFTAIGNYIASVEK
jgi:hypothetical protein